MNNLNKWQSVCFAQVTAPLQAPAYTLPVPRPPWVRATVRAGTMRRWPGPKEKHGYALRASRCAFLLLPRWLAPSLWKAAAEHDSPELPTALLLVASGS